MVLNRIVAHLLAGLDAAGRRMFLEELNAPAGGWERVDANLLAAIDWAAAGGED